jgi:CTP:molybdopterin cytidylyltransferase MocA
VIVPDEPGMLALLQADLRAVTSDAVVFFLPDQPGALARVAQRFGQHQVNVRTSTSCTALPNTPSSPSRPTTTTSLAARQRLPALMV